MFCPSGTDLKVWRGSSLQPIELEMETQLSCEWCWIALTRFSTCGRDHICIQQMDLTTISWSSRQRARHTRCDLGCPFPRAVSPWLNRETMTQVMRTCQITSHVALQAALFIHASRHSVRSSWCCERRTHQKSRSSHAIFHLAEVSSISAAPKWYSR